MLVCGFALQIALARLLGVELYGLYGLILSLLVWFELFMTGSSRAFSMRVAERPSESRSFRLVAIKVMLLMGLAVFGLSSIAAFFLPDLFGRPGTTHYFLLAFLDIPLIGFFYMSQGLLNGLHLYKHQSIALVAYYLSRLVFSILLVALGLSLTGAIIANLACSLAGIIVSAWFFDLLSKKPGGKSQATLRGLLRSIVPFVILPIIFNILVFFNLWVIGAVASTIELGIYNAAFSVSRIILLLFTSMTIAVFPAITTSIYSGDSNRTTRLLRQSSRFLLLLVSPICLFIAFTSDTIMQLFGDVYTTGAGSVSLLVIGFLILALLSLFNYIEMANHQFWTVISINAFAVALEIGLSIPLTKRLGIEGAAISLIIASSVACLLQLYIVSKQFGPPLTLVSACRILAASGLCASILMPIESLWLLLPSYVLAFALYALLIIYLNELDIDEIKYWIGVLVRSERNMRP